MKDKTHYIRIAKEIIRSYLDKKEALSEIGFLLNEEADEKYTILKEHITAIKSVMDKALKEIEKLENKDENV